MTKREALIVSAYTGILMVNFGDLHEFAEARLGRPILTHEFGSVGGASVELKEAVEDDFLAICEEVNSAS